MEVDEATPEYLVDSYADFIVTTLLQPVAELLREHGLEAEIVGDAQVDVGLRVSSGSREAHWRAGPVSGWECFNETGQRMGFISDDASPEMVVAYMERQLEEGPRAGVRELPL